VVRFLACWVDSTQEIQDLREPAEAEVEERRYK
jgi:hypothetical protein